MKVDRNARLCSKDVQRRLNRAIELIDTNSLFYILRLNMIETTKVNRAIALLHELKTGRTNQLPIKIGEGRYI